MNSQKLGVYDNAYGPNNVYGHTLKVLVDHCKEDVADKIHLDIGCGYGRIAEPLTARLHLKYVAIDNDEGGLASLRMRGFETHQLWLEDEEKTYRGLRSIVDGRSVASISFLDTLEHLVDGDAVLRAISRFALDHTAFVAISVPNVAHNDIGFKLAFGKWDYTKSGLLDHTHLRLFNATMLEKVLRSAGLYQIASNDVLMAQSDQNFPEGHAALARGSQLHGYLARLRLQADGLGNVYQFVRLCVPGRPTKEATFLNSADESVRPFLSVIMRTQGRRPHTMIEALTALAGQSDSDFELIVTGHKLPRAEQTLVEQIIEDCPEWLRKKCQLVLVNEGNRTRPLNEGFTAARGLYIAILDDDDLPFGHWVETFRKLHFQQPGRMLRAAAVRQNVQSVKIEDHVGLRALERLEQPYPSDFDLLAHLRSNQTPNHCIAFPRSGFHDLGIRFDESLTTTEDWDYIIRVVSVVGSVSSPEITSIYRWWTNEESALTVHSKEEWERNYQRILKKMDEGPILLPTGSISRIRHLLDSHDRMLRMDSKTIRINTKLLKSRTYDALGRLSDKLVGLPAAFTKLFRKKSKQGNSR